MAQPVVPYSLVGSVWTSPGRSSLAGPGGPGLTPDAALTPDVALPPSG